MDLSALSEEEQIAMAIQMSMQDSEMEESDASRPTTAATDNTEASPLPMDTEQVFYHVCNISSGNLIDFLCVRDVSLECKGR